MWHLGFVILVLSGPDESKDWLIKTNKVLSYVVPKCSQFSASICPEFHECHGGLGAMVDWSVEPIFLFEAK